MQSHDALQPFFGLIASTVERSQLEKQIQFQGIPCVAAGTEPASSRQWPGTVPGGNRAGTEPAVRPGTGSDRAGTGGDRAGIDPAQAAEIEPAQAMTEPSPSRHSDRR